MAQSSSDGEEEEDPNNIVLTSLSLTAETTTGTLTCPPDPELPTLPFDVLTEILCRLPIKLLVQLRRLCKFFHSLISDPNFAKKHLQLSTKRHHLMVTTWNKLDSNLDNMFVLHDSPIPLVFSTSTVVTQAQLDLPNSITIVRNYVSVMCSCDGIFCGEINVGSYFLWNPSIRKFKLLPPLENPGDPLSFSISFGYDHYIDNYKLIVVSEKNMVSVYTLGTDYWTRIQDIPYDYDSVYGIFVSGTVNWLASDNSSIISLDLEKESYQMLLLPDVENENVQWNLGVVRDCLCLFASTDVFLDVWIMKEYGNKESCTKLYIVPHIQDQGFKAYIVSYISEDDQLLVEFGEMRGGKIKLVVYDSKTDTLNIPMFQNNYEQICPIVYIESLISP